MSLVTLLARLVFSALLAAVAIAATPAFEDGTEAAGLLFRHQASKTARKYLPETMSGGVALLDFDSDGFMDVFFVNGARIQYPHPPDQEPDKSDPRFWNRLYRNRGDRTFEDVTERAGLQGRGYGMGAAVGDYDDDGDPDLLVTSISTGDYPAAVLYRNDGERFEDVSSEAGLHVRGWATSAGFVDYDADGDLDLFIGRYMDWSYDQDLRCGLETTYGRSYCHPDLFPAVDNYLYRNDGDGTFTDLRQESGIAVSKGKALGVAFADYDRDGWIDIAVANDSHPQFLFHNEGDGTFREAALFAGAAYDEHGEEFAGMGVLFEDLDGDGWPDLLMTNLSPQKYALFRNARDGAFEYATDSSGLGRATRLSSGWGVGAIDYDRDGAKDLFFANAHVMDNIARSQPHLRYLEPPQLLRYEGGAYRVVASEQAGPLFQQPRAGRGVAFGDLDNDGDVDVVVSNLDGDAYLAWNESSPELGWIGLDIELRNGRAALGAQVELLLDDGSSRYGHVTRAGSYLSSNDPRLFFGLGGADGVRSIQIRWPDGASQEIGALPANQIHRIRQGGPVGDR